MVGDILNWSGMTMAVLWTLVLNGALGFGADLVARFGAGQKRGSCRILGAVVVGWAWLTVGMQLLGSLGWLSRLPLVAWSICLILVGISCRLRHGGGFGKVD